MENPENKPKKQHKKVDWGAVLLQTREIMHTVGMVLFHFRKIILSIPIVWGSMYLARMNMEKLPAQVGIGLMSNGKYAYTATLEQAVYGPIAVTGICLILMFCSRRATYPWLISLFTLALPILILITNIFPA